MENYTFFNQFFGIMLMLTGIMLKLFPPVKYTWYYGLQIKPALRSKETWHEANRYIVNPLLLFGILNIIIGFWPSLLPDFGRLDLFVTVTFAALSIWLSILFTVIHLNRVFDKNGNRKDHA